MRDGKSIKLSEAASMVGGRLVGPDTSVNGFCSLNLPREGMIAFVEKHGSFDPDLEPKPSGLIVSKVIPNLDGTGQIVAENPRVAFVVLQRFFNPQKIAETDFRHPNSTVDESAKITAPVHIGAECVVSECAIIGRGTILDALVYIGARVKIGSECWIQAGVKILNDVIIGDRCIIGAGTVIGAEGFGFVPREEQIVKVPQTGTVMIGDDVEIGANCAVDRAAIDATIIGDQTKLDNLVQVGHNVIIGKRVRIAGQCGFAGGVTIGDDVVMGGQAGVAHGVRIGNGAMIGGRSGVTRDVPGGKAVSGFPAMDHRKMLAVQAATRRLPGILKKGNVAPSSDASHKEGN